MATNKTTTLIEEHILKEDKRLDRIEEKIDRLSETVISLARAEEKLGALEQDRNTINERLNKHSDRIDNMEDSIVEQAVTVRVINRIFWITITAGVGVMAAQYIIQ
jgi:3-methyladenine DNA glycosylase/8-oxoguanine DNA glycosylase